MKRLFCIFALLSVVSFASFAQAGDTFINGIDKDYPPFAYIDEKGQPAGFDVDSMNWIADKMGFTVEHKPYEWKSIIQMVVENKIQMVCSGLSITPERSAQVMFTEPYWTVRKVFVGKKNSTLTTDKIINGKVKLGVQQGTNEATMLQYMLNNKEANFTLVQYATPSDAIADVLNGRIVAAAMDSAPAENAQRMGRAVQEVGTFGEIDEFGVAINKNNPELLTLINEGYKRLKADPYWEVLKQKYQPTGH